MASCLASLLVNLQNKFQINKHIINDKLDDIHVHGIHVITVDDLIFLGYQFFVAFVVWGSYPQILVHTY